jgi:hypothetical protein
MELQVGIRDALTTLVMNIEACNNPMRFLSTSFEAPLGLEAFVHPTLPGKNSSQIWKHSMCRWTHRQHVAFPPGHAGAGTAAASFSIISATQNPTLSSSSAGHHHTRE